MSNRSSSLDFSLPQDRVVHRDAAIPRRASQLGMSHQQLNGPQILVRV